MARLRWRHAHLGLRVPLSDEPGPHAGRNLRHVAGREPFESDTIDFLVQGNPDDTDFHLESEEQVRYQ